MCSVIKEYNNMIIFINVPHYFMVRVAHVFLYFYIVNGVLVMSTYK